jgi:histidine ammonia-lyase
LEIVVEIVELVLQIEELHNSFRKKVSFLAADRNTSLDMKAALNFVKKSLKIDSYGR